MALSKNIEKRYLELGGEIAYNSKVDKVLVENNQAKGVQSEDGSTEFADSVVSAADDHSTIFKMLDGKYVNDPIQAYFKAAPKTQPFGLEVWYGVALDLSKEPHALVLFQEEPVRVENKERDRLDVEVFGFDPTLAPEGKTVIKVVLDSQYDYWKDLSANPEKYRLEKQKVADSLAERLDKRFPGFKNHIEAVDVVTPVSVEHWTGSYRGCQAWGAPKEYAKLLAKMVSAKHCRGYRTFIWLGSGLEVQSD